MYRASICSNRIESYLAEQEETYEKTIDFRFYAANFVCLRKLCVRS